jgi:hypothetical protein
MSNTNTKSNPMLTETIAVRLSADESRALAAIAQRSDRTISYVVRAHLRECLLNPQRSV